MEQGIGHRNKQPRGIIIIILIMSVGLFVLYTNSVRSVITVHKVTLTFIKTTSKSIPTEQYTKSTGVIICMPLNETND